ncbi:serine/threonine-protein kinase [Nocardia africana]|uniref:non-specific serine/threonine protein kinase n=1 Tax=Nocardia africana TaxID=134964 RepID=A0A378X0B3_9NOCA|nr:serine/threonine-protein kinase [Nocardia africana]MCC3311847.1 protein kinase [Nocardia africana]SUA46879.1 Serine/threonine-protein kinase pknF [Nocardia africana]
MLNNGDVFAGFTVERLLGQGGMGSVYLARHPRLPRLTALKLLNRELYTDAEIRARFEREADLCAQLDHPGIVAVYDRGVEDDQLWICMQYVDGVDAATVNPLTLPPERAVQIIDGVADALDYAHGNGVLHRDVKPANILLARAVSGKGERVFLTDFGIARLREDSTHLTQAGMFTATLAYASPEQMTGVELDHRSDQYSLACALYWLLTGTGPFDSEHPTEVIRGHLQLPVPPASARRAGLSPAMDGVIARAMAKRASERFGSCREFAAAARAALNAPAGMPTASGAAPTLVRPGGPAPVQNSARVPAGPQPGNHTQGYPPANGASVPAGPHPGTHTQGYPPANGARVPTVVPLGGQHYSPAANTAGPSNTASARMPMPAAAHSPAAPPPGMSSPASPSPAGYSAPPPGYPPGPGYRPQPPKRSGAMVASIIIAVLVVVAIIVTIVVVVLQRNESKSAEDWLHETQALDKQAATITELFPALAVPAPRLGYGGASCIRKPSGQNLLALTGNDLELGKWTIGWDCVNSGDTPSYAVLKYASSADAQAMVAQLTGSPQGSGRTGTVSYTSHVNPPSSASLYYRWVVLSFGPDSERGRCLVIASSRYSSFMNSSDGLSESEFAAWWRKMPLT